MGLIIYFSMGIGRGFIMGMEFGRDIVSVADRNELRLKWGTWK